MTATELADRIEWRDAMARTAILERRQREVLADGDRKVWISPSRFPKIKIERVDVDSESAPEQAA